MNDKETFQKFAGALQFFSKIIFWVGVVGAALLAVFTVAVKVPFVERLLTRLLQTEGADLSVTFNGFELNLDNFPVDELLQVAFVGGIIEIFTILVVLFLLWELIQILGAVKSGVPFTSEAIKHIYRLGFGIIVYSVVGGTGEGIMNAMFLQISVIQEFFSSIDFSAHISLVDIQILLAGLFVLLLGKIFQYGLFLQSEYDDTI